jgi:hypothetical protein
MEELDNEEWAMLVHFSNGATTPPFDDMEVMRRLMWLGYIGRVKDTIDLFIATTEGHDRLEAERATRGPYESP